MELRAAVQGAAVSRDRVSSLVEECAPWLALVDRDRVVDRRRVDREGLQALLRATYRGARRAAAAQVDALDALDVTLASDVCVFTPLGQRVLPRRGRAETPPPLRGAPDH
jgi:hypothetical protein